MKQIYRHILLLAVIFALLMGCSQKKKTVPSVPPAETLGQAPNPVTVLYLKGSYHEMGVEYGQQASDAIQYLVNKLDSVTAAMGITQDKIMQAYAAMEPFIPKKYKDEMAGLAEGSGVPLEKIHMLHAIPDLSEYHCTFFVAWDKATKDHDLYQIRALDYAMNAHFQDHPALIVYKPDSANAFVDVGWLGFIGVVSGMNDQQLAVSEIGENFGPEHETLQGEPMPFVLRDVLEQAKTVEEGIDIIKKAKRTSSFLYAIGSGKQKYGRALKTAKDIFEVYDDTSLPKPVPHLKDIVYFSMGCDWDRTTPGKYNVKTYNFLKSHWGQIDEQVAKDLMHTVGTGDLHAVVYRPSTLDIWVANAGIDRTPAYNREYVHLNLKEALAKFTK
ncbi:MAG: hypothetical protein GXO76_15955 [Calditrichaeota bacterium]|nr:hypothetical protein [Calditrichota bacterium]